MDRRKIVVEKGKTFYESLNSDELNLEIANNLENLLDLREIIKMKARQTYDERKESGKTFTFFKSADNLESNPKYAYIFSLVSWWILFKAQKVSKVSLLFVLFGISIYYNLKRQNYCKLQKEYEDYKKLNDVYHQIVRLKKKSITLETFIYKTMHVDYSKFEKENKFNFVKYEYL